MKHLLFLMILCYSFVGIKAQNTIFYDAYITNRMDLWKIEMDKMELECQAENDMDMIFDLTLAQYGYIAYCMAMDRKKMAKDYVLKAVQNAERMLQYDPGWARAHALRGAIYGYEAGQAPYKAFILGTRAIKEVDRAFEIDPANPYIWMEQGNINLYKPRIFGGNKNDAIKDYLKAIELFEKDPLFVESNWLYLNTLLGLARAYNRTDRIKRADQSYQKILEVEPEFKWIRDDVYPKFRKKYFKE